MDLQFCVRAEVVQASEKNHKFIIIIINIIIIIIIIIIWKNFYVPITEIFLMLFSAKLWAIQSK